MTSCKMRRLQHFFFANCYPLPFWEIKETTSATTPTLTVLPSMALSCYKSDRDTVRSADLALLGESLLSSWAGSSRQDSAMVTASILADSSF